MDNKEKRKNVFGGGMLVFAAHAGVILVALALEIAMAAKSGYGNSYYAAAVRSMLQSWHNFFFVSYDPAGFITVDKPPLALWLQTASAKIFGFRGWALLLPSVLAQVASVEIVYRMVRRAAGNWGGIVAALFLALTPISAVLGGTNETDSVLVLLMLLSGWALLKSIESEKFWHLALSAVFIGLAFNVKMLQAYILLPAFFAAYFFAGHKKMKRKIVQLSAAACIILAVSFSWVLAVDMVPASQRPYVGSTQDNSELSLAIGYNGMQRIVGQTSGFMLGTGGTGAGGRNGFSGAQSSADTDAIGASDNAQKTPMQMPGNSDSGDRGASGNHGGGPGNGGPGGGGNNFGGESGAFRLWGSALGGQIGWFLVFALAGILAIFLREKPHWPLSEKQAQGVFWAMWLFAGGAVFSIAQFMHPYYTATIAPPIAALCGIGASYMAGLYREDGWKRFLLPVSFIAAAAGQWAILSKYPSYANMKIAASAVMAAAALALLAGALSGRLKNERLCALAMAAGIAGMLIAPAAWIQYSLSHPVNSTIPSAGPEAESKDNGMDRGGPVRQDGRGGGRGMQDGRPPQQNLISGDQGARYGGNGGSAPAGMPESGAGPGGGSGGNSMFGSSQADEKLVDYLLENKGNAKYIVATESSHSADALIINTGEPVLAWGGFSGTDPAIDAETLKQYVADGTVRYFLMSYGGMGGGNNSAISSWVSKNCKIAESTSLSGGNSLYDCAGVK